MNISSLLSCNSCGADVSSSIEGMSCSLCETQYPLSNKIFRTTEIVSEDDGLWDAVLEKNNGVSELRKNYYNEMGNDYVTSLTNLWNEYDKKLKESGSGVVLDVCTGFGGFLIDSLKNISSDSIVFGTEIEEVPIEHMKGVLERNPDYFERFHLLAGDVLKVPLKSESVDLVISNHLGLEGKMGELMKTVHRVLKPGGKILTHSFLLDIESETIGEMRNSGDSYLHKTKQKMEEAYNDFGFEVSACDIFYEGRGSSMDGIGKSDDITLALVELIKR